MPLPIVLGIGAAAALVGGIGTGISGGKKIKQANETLKLAKKQYKEIFDRYEKIYNEATASLDNLGTYELKILQSFETLSDLMEKLQNRPEIKAIKKNGVNIKTYTPEEIKQASIEAGVVLGSLGGAAAGTAGGIAAAGATTVLVTAFGTASTGAAISSLTGAAATNATLAALGGGSLAAGGGGVALGSALLGGVTVGAGLLIAGIIIRITGSKLSEKADEAKKQMEKIEVEVKKVCKFLTELKSCSDSYYSILQSVDSVYSENIEKMKSTVCSQGKTNWKKLSKEEKTNVENTVYLASLLYKMCSVNLVLVSDDENQMNEVNALEVEKVKQGAEKVLLALGANSARCKHSVFN